MKPIKVLFVCLGNICRSPTADAVLQKIVSDRELAMDIHIDSAGTSDWHIGKAPDLRSQKHARQRGYDMSILRARQVKTEDFLEFDYILAMDSENLKNLQVLLDEHRSFSENFNGHLGLFLEFSQQDEYTQVPDPYYEGDEGFELVLDLIEDACEGLIQDILHKYA